MQIDEALDPETTVPVAKALAELRLHQHDPKVQDGWIVVSDDDGNHQVAEVTSGTVKTFDVMAWLGY